MKYPDFLKPHATDDLIRIGNDNDGGYVVPKRVLQSSNALISMGLSDEWSFEKAFYESSGIPLVVFDHTVNSRFWIRHFLSNIFNGLLTCRLHLFIRSLRFIDYLRFFNGNRRHIKMKIGKSLNGGIDIMEAFKYADSPSSCFLKIDIEGSEYRVLEQIEGLASNISGLVIEFHDIDLHFERIERFARRLETTHIIVHFHANNYGTLLSESFSTVIELTLLNKSLMKTNEVLLQKQLPIPSLDCPNDLSKPDVIPCFSKDVTT